jgi:2,4-diaminopentanoate dehydrogenase
VANASPVTVSVIGLGAVGAGILKAALTDPRLAVVSCIDPRPDRGAVAAAAEFGGPCYADVGDAAEIGDVAIIAATSDAARTIAIAEPLVSRGISIVTTCEAMLCARPAQDPALRSLDALARAAGVTVLATGVNPGFVLDLLPVVCGVATRQIESITLVRRVNVATRREKLQEKVGVGIGMDEFQVRQQERRIGHVGLRESVSAVADAYGWQGETVETVDPVLDDSGQRSLGVRHEATFSDRAGSTRVEALLEMYAGAPDEDTIIVRGVPPIHAHFPGGTSGDEATLSAVLNAAAGIRSLTVGFLGISALAPPHWTTGVNLEGHPAASPMEEMAPDG